MTRLNSAAGILLASLDSNLTLNLLGATETHTSVAHVALISRRFSYDSDESIL
jgi:hypothetical protein